MRKSSEPLPMDFLIEVKGSENPRLVLHKLARNFVPFIESKMGESQRILLRLPMGLLSVERISPIFGPM